MPDRLASRHHGAVVGDAPPSCRRPSACAARARPGRRAAAAPSASGPPSAGETATIAWRARIAPPSSVRSTTSSPSCSTAATARAQPHRVRPSRSASRSHSCWLPPTKWSCCAPPSNSVSEVEPAARLQVEEEVEQRELLGLGAEHELGGEVEEHPRTRGAQVAARERVDGLRVPVGDRARAPTAARPAPCCAAGRAAAARCRARRATAARAAGASRGTCAAGRRTRAPRARPDAGAPSRTPSSRASAATRSWVGPIQCAPRSAWCPPTVSVRILPPTRSRASSTVTERPPARSRRAALSPLSPPPTIATSTVLLRLAAGHPRKLTQRVRRATRPAGDAGRRSASARTGCLR